MRCNFISLDPFWFRPRKFRFLLVIVVLVVFWLAILMNLLLIQCAHFSVINIGCIKRKMSLIKIAPATVLQARTLPLLRSLNQQYYRSHDVIRKINDLFQAVKDQFRVTSVSINAKGVLIKGVTHSAQIVALFSQRLRQKLKGSVKVSKMRLIKGGRIEFSVSVQ